MALPKNIVVVKSNQKREVKFDDENNFQTIIAPGEMTLGVVEIFLLLPQYIFSYGLGPILWAFSTYWSFSEEHQRYQVQMGFSSSNPFIVLAGKRFVDGVFGGLESRR